MSDYMNQPDDGAFLAEDYGMHGMQAKAPERDLEIIEDEILSYKRQAGRSIIEIGKRLNEAKAQLNHGEWLLWLREKVDISERSARDFMRLAREYSKSAEIADLGAAKALALLALSPSERENFVAEKHEVDGVEKSVADMTAKELKKAIEERDDARKTMEAMKARAEVAEQSREKMEQDMRQLKELSKRAKEAEEQKATALAAEADQKHKAALTAKEDDIRKLKEDLRKAREEAKAANINLQTAEREARAAKDEVAKANKMAQVNSNQNMVKFSVLFQQAQETVNQMADAVGKEPAENQAKMKAALNALAQAIEKVACA